MMNLPIRVAISGAAGQIAYSLLFRIASGEMLGPEQPVILHLLEVTPALPLAHVVAMELEDCAYPLLEGIVVTDDADIAFQDVRYALLVGAKPRGPGMERSDLLMANAQIFQAQGRSLNEVAAREVKVTVVGNPANTNAYIAMQAAPDIPPRQFTALTRLDHSRAIGQLANHLIVPISSVQHLAIWGNHSPTQYPDVTHCTVHGKLIWESLDPDWLQHTYIPEIQQRGAKIIQQRGKSSAASAAHAALYHVKDWAQQTAPGEWISMAVPSDGSYGVPEGLIFSFPVTVQQGQYTIVPNLPISPFSQRYLDQTLQELMRERDAVEAFLSI